MSREAFGDPPESQEPPDLCPVCGNDWHSEDCVFGKEVARRLKAERDAHRLAFENEQLRRATERGGYAHAQRWERGAVLDVNCKDGTQLNVRLPKKG